MEEEASTAAALASVVDLCLTETELRKRKEKQRASQRGSAEMPGAVSQRAGCSAPVATCLSGVCAAGQGAQVF